MRISFVNERDSQRTRVRSRRRRVLFYRALFCVACVCASSIVRANETRSGVEFGEIGSGVFCDRVERVGVFQEYLYGNDATFDGFNAWQEASGTSRALFGALCQDGRIGEGSCIKNESEEERVAESRPLSEAIGRVDSFSPFVDLASKETASPRPQATYNGSSFNVTQDAIVRGSVNLPSFSMLQVWANGYFGSGHISPRAWDGRLRENNSGAAIGLNLPFGELGTLSAYYNYHRNRLRYDSHKIQQEDDAFGAAFYMNAGGFYMSAMGFYGDDEYAARDYSVGTSAQIKGYQATGYFETGYEMATLGLFVLKPFGSYQYSNLKHGNFDPTTLETRSGPRKYNSCLMTLGSRIDVNLAGLDVFTCQGRMAWVTQLRSKSESFQSFCYGRVPGTVAPSQPYFLGKGAGNDFFWGGVGLRLSLMGMLSIAADYDCLVNKYQTLNEGSVGLLFGF